MNEKLKSAIAHHQAGQLDLAEPLYLDFLARNPNRPDVLHYLGLLHCQKNNPARGLQFLQQALALQPDNPEALINLALALTALNRPDEAIPALERALSLNPDFPDAHFNLANLLATRHDYPAAIKHLNHAIFLRNNNPPAFHNLGTMHAALGKHDHAISAFEHSLRLHPNQPDTLHQRALSLLEKNRLPEAITALQKALALRPHFPDAAGNLANALRSAGQFDAAIAAYHHTLSLSPNHPTALANLAYAQLDAQQFDDAIDTLHTALPLTPDPLQKSQLHLHLAHAHKARGELDDALAHYRHAITLDPANLLTHSQLLYPLYYHPDSTPESIYTEHAAWAEKFTAEPAEIAKKTKSKTPVPLSASSALSAVNPRPLRIGYVSPDFRDHVVGRNVLPLFRHHDHKNFHIAAYFNSPDADDLTAQFRDLADQWRDVHDLTDDQLAAQIRADQIDILVDLTLHMHRHRLLVFAQKPAPIQITFAGYPGTTGLTQIDYRLTDPYLDPPTTPAASGGAGQCARTYSETSLHLPHTFWCFDPLTTEPPVNPLPALTNPHLTFGSLNTFCKVTPPTLHLWSQVLHALPTSRMLLLAPQGATRARIIEQLRIDPSRISFTDRQLRPAYLALYNQIDIALDTSPYNGHTTSLDACWMGVPVITLVGTTAVSRAGLSQLTNLNLTDLIAHTPEQFVQIAKSFATNLPRLAELRATLRQRMQSSPLMNAPLFTRHIEDLYRRAWQHSLQ